MAKPTAEYVRSRLHYEPETGAFTWRERPVVTQYDKTWNARYAGKEAGVRSSKRGEPGYVFICLDYVKYGAHRLAWLYVKGEWPEDDIDHRDLDKANNRFRNLRPASKGQNRWNEGVRRNNSSGYKGVYLNKSLNKWQAYITINSKYKYIGIFDSAEEAAIARDGASIALHGDFACLNFPKEAARV